MEFQTRQILSAAAQRRKEESSPLASSEHIQTLNTDANNLAFRGRVAQKAKVRREPFVYLGLLLLTLATFWPVLKNDFTIYDDPEYVTSNVHVQSGLTKSTVHWAFTSTDSSNWHPLTWLSHALDWQLFGSNPKGHHAMNLGFHAANVLLLFLVLQQLTGKLWPSAFVAALFAVHPLHVESVAWVAERKDVLSTFFELLALLAYSRYARKKSTVSYLLTLILFALGLMAKPMVVTLPLLLLLIDFWPLQRFALKPMPETKGKPGPVPDKRSSASQLLLEKIPFLALTLLSCVITYSAQAHGGSTTSGDSYPLGGRLENALVSYATYLAKMIWPTRLAVFYPLEYSLPPWKILASGAVVIFLCWLSITKMRTRPYLLTGWFWFLIMLVPVIGIVQVGAQAMADRYTYLALTGPFIIIAWGAAELAERFKWAGFAISLAFAGAIAACAADTRTQLAYWKDSLSLFGHAASVTPENAVTENNLGSELMNQRHLDEALIHLQRSLAIWPNYKNAHFNLGLLRALRGELSDAEAEFKMIIESRPEYIPAHRSLGLLLISTGRYAEAEGQLRFVLRFQPEDINIRRELGVALAMQQKNDEAEIELKQVLHATPDDAAARQDLGNVLAAKGDMSGAISEYSALVQASPTNNLMRASLARFMLKDGQTDKATALLKEGLNVKPALNIYLLLASISVQNSNALEAVGFYKSALQLKPDAPAILNDLAWLRATSPDDKVRDGAEAVGLAEKACSLSKYQQAAFIGTLAAAYAEAGRFSDAVATAQKACDEASAAGNQTLLKKDQELLELFRSGHAYRENQP